MLFLISNNKKSHTVIIKITVWQKDDRNPEKSTNILLQEV